MTFKKLNLANALNIAAMMVLISQSFGVYADCLSGLNQRDQFSELKSAMLPGTILGTSLSATGYVTASLLASNGTASSAIVLGLGTATGYVANLPLAALVYQEFHVSVLKALFREAQIGEGRVLRKVLKQLSEKDPTISLQEAAKLISEGNSENRFCHLDGQGTAVSYLTASQIVQYLKDYDLPLVRLDK